MNKKKGNLFVLVGPSGSGKGTVLKEVLNQDDNLFLSISATTRQPREGEVDGKHYFFVEQDEFKGNIEKQLMLEYAEYCGNYYGTPKQAVIQHLDKGEDVILEIEMQGAKQIKQLMPMAKLVFIVPPSVEVLKSRLTGRNTETQEVIEKRMKTALDEIDFAKDCDYLIINDKLQDAISDLQSLIKACGLSAENQMGFISELRKV